MKRLWGKIHCASQIFEKNFNNNEIYDNGIPQEVKEGE